MHNHPNMSAPVNAVINAGEMAGVAASTAGGTSPLHNETVTTKTIDPNVHPFDISKLPAQPSTGNNQRSDPYYDGDTNEDDECCGFGIGCPIWKDCCPKLDCGGPDGTTRKDCCRYTICCLCCCFMPIWLCGVDM